MGPRAIEGVIMTKIALDKIHFYLKNFIFKTKSKVKIKKEKDIFTIVLFFKDLLYDLILKYGML